MGFVSRRSGAGFTVYALEHPGTTPEAHDDIYRLDGLWDLILCHDELLTALKIEEALVVGHSFGGMVACELAAAYPRRVRRLALIDPIVNWVKLGPAELPNYIFRNPAVEAAQNMFGPSEPPDAAIAARVRLMWAMGATSKFIWPIPDKGLKKRIHRVSAPTLIVWGGTTGSCRQYTRTSSRSASPVRGSISSRVPVMRLTSNTRQQ